MGHNLALVLTPLLFFAVVRAVHAWRNPPPTGAANSDSDTEAQVTASVPANPARGRGVSDKPDTPVGRGLDAVARWADRALRRIGRGR